MALDSGSIEALRAFRWFGVKDRRLAGVVVRDVVPLAGHGSDLALGLVDVQVAEGDSLTYLLLLANGCEDGANPGEVGGALVQQLLAEKVLRSAAGGSLRLLPFGVLPASLAEAPVRPLGAEQSNTSLKFGDLALLKLYRRLQPGTHPDLEIGAFLTTRAHFTEVPRVLAGIEYVARDGVSWTIGMLQEYVVSRGDAWQTTLARLRQVVTDGSSEDNNAPLEAVAEATARLHLALCEGDDSPDARVSAADSRTSGMDVRAANFGPELVTVADVARWSSEVEAQVQEALAALARTGRATHRQVGPRWTFRLDSLIGTEKIRHHGDYHLGQVLERMDGGLSIVDFEGEPARPLDWRRRKHTSLRDVAGILRSLDYARHSIVRELNGEFVSPGQGPGGRYPEGGIRPESHPLESQRRDAAPVARLWCERARAAFVERYVSTVRASRPTLVPGDDEAVAEVLAVLETEKAAYEVLYELNHRPDWVEIPAAALTAGTSLGEG